MASKKKNPVAPAENNQAQTQTEQQPATRKARTPVVLQPELAVEIENCKKRISSLKALNKLTPVIQQMDKDAINALHKILEARCASLS